MKKKLVLITLAALAINVPCSSFAAEKMKKEPASSAKPARTAAKKEEPAAAPAAATERALPFQAVVESVDASGKSFTSKTKAGKVTTFTITSETAITRDEAPAKLADIKPGETVRGTRVKVGEDQWQAVKVMIGAKKGAGVKEDAAETTAATAKKPARGKKGAAAEATAE